MEKAVANIGSKTLHSASISSGGLSVDGSGNVVVKGGQVVIERTDGTILATLDSNGLRFYDATGTHVVSEVDTVGDFVSFGNGNIAGIKGLFVYNGTPGSGNLVGSWAYTAGTDSFGNAYGPGVTVGTGSSQVILQPNANNVFGAGTLQAATQYTTSDTHEMMPSMAGAVLFNQGAANQQMATVIHSPIGSGNGYAMVLTADSDDATVHAGLSFGTVTTDGMSMTYTPQSNINPTGSVTSSSVLLYGAPSSASTVTYIASGSHTWTAPAGVTSVKAECWGGGGGGANPLIPPPGGGGGGCGGGGGEYAAELTVAVTPGHNYTVTVGSGGAGGTGGANGGNTTFAGDSLTVTANGGVGGTSGTGGSGGTGSTNTTHHNGGTGGLGGSVGAGTYGGGGGGGSSALVTSAGTNGVAGSGSAAGGGGSGFPSGGSGGGGVGQSGFTPGGGGGGGDITTSPSLVYDNGGAGAAGQVRLTFIPSGNPLTTSIAGASGTDSFGNSFPAGIQVKSTAGHLQVNPGVGGTGQPFVAFDVNGTSIATITAKAGAGSVTQLDIASGNYTNSNSANAIDFLNLDENSILLGFALEPSGNNDGGQLNLTPSAATLSEVTNGTVNNTFQLTSSGTTTTKPIVFDTSWTNASLQNGWSSAGSPNPPVSFRRMPDGTVRFRGTATGGTRTDGTLLMTLPSGYYNTTYQDFPPIGYTVAGTAARLVINQANGQVTIDGMSTAAGFIQFDNFSLILI